MRDPRVVGGVVVAVLAVWVIGAAVTRFTLEQMAYLAPVAVLVIGATIGIGLLWVKIVLQLVRGRRA
jgi:hypothetical protein